MGGNPTDPQFLHLWKMYKFQAINIFRNDSKAQKNGAHRSVYWVKVWLFSFHNLFQKKQRQEDGSIKGEKWQHASRYIGDWKDNCKDGFGIQFYQNGDKYEGMWA